VADLANLRISVDSRDVSAATTNLDTMANAAGRTNASVDRLAAANQRMAAALATSNKPLIDATRYLTSMQTQLEQVGRSSLQIKALEIRMAAAAAPTAELAQEIRNVGAALIRAERNMGGASNGMQQVANRTSLAAHEVTNLAYQFQDLGVQLASGQNPLVALVQQGSQVSGVMMSSGMSVGQFGKAILSMIGNATKALLLNPIFLALAGAAGAVGLAFNFMADDISKASGVSVQAGDVMLGAFDVVRNFLSNQVTAAFAYFGTTAGEVWDAVVGYTRKAINIIIGIVSLIPRAFVEAFKTVPVAIEKLLSGDLTGAMQVLGSSMGKIAGGTFGTDYIGQIGSVLKDASVKRAIKRQAEESGKKIGKDTASGIAKGVKDASEEFTAAIEALVAEKKKIGMSPEDIRMMEIEALAAKATAKGYEDLAKQLLQAGKEWKQAHDAFKASELRKEANKEIEATLKALENEYLLLGLTGEERARAALELEREGYIAKYVAALGLDEATAAWERYRAAKEKIIDKESAIAKERKEAEKLKQQLEGVVRLLDDMTGGAASKIKDIIVTVKANFDTKELKEAFKSIGKSLTDALKKAGLDIGKLSKTLGAASAGAQIGAGVNSIFNSLGVKSSKAGAQAGGAIGAAAFGPVGAIAGSILGGVLGGMLKKTKTGSATISQIAGQGMQTALSGNSKALKDVANSMATGLLKGLGDMAEQLGGTLGGAVKLSIGQRNKNFVVDPTGAGRTKGSGVINFGQDQAAAVAYVTQLAIQQGIVTGISAGAQTLIRAGDDLSAQVQKALKFDQVFKDLMKETDPLNASLAELSTEMEKLKAIFKEAGASAEEYAKLEELFAIRQAKAIFEANKPRRELEIRLMEAQGNTTAALAARRQLELESMDASLRTLQLQIWAAEDAAEATQKLVEAQESAAEEARAAAEAARALAADRRSLEIDLMEALGNSSEALALRREMELEAMDASLQGLQKQIWAALDARKATEEAAAAAQAFAEQQAKALEAANKLAADRRELEIQLLEAQGFAVEALAARRQLELEATDETLRGLKQQIWAAQAKAEADLAASKMAEEAAAAQAKAADEAADAMQKYMDTLADVTKTVTDEINRLRGINAASTSVMLKAQFATLTAQARTGNLDALAKLPELSRSIEEATLGSATSALEVARIRAWLSASLAETLAAQSASNAEINTAGAGLIFDGNQTTAASSSAQTADALSNMRGEMYNMMYQIAKNTGKSYELMDRWDGDGLPDIREDASDYY
jgi:hypothetical protein